MAGTIDMYGDDHHIIVGLTSEVDRKIMRCVLMLNATRRQLGLPECDLTRMCRHQEVSVQVVLLNVVKVYPRI